MPDSETELLADYRRSCSVPLPTFEFGTGKERCPSAMLLQQEDRARCVVMPAWQSLKRISRAHPGRQIRNQLSGQRDQKVKNRDRRIGGLIWRLHGTDKFGAISSEQFIRSYPDVDQLKILLAP